MALNTDQKAAILDKTAQGKSSTSMVRDFFEEPFNGRPIVLPSQVWNEAEDIPTTAPSGMVHDQIIGVVQRKIDVSLTAVLGTTASFQSDDLIDAIPFNFGDGSYNYELKDDNDNPIAFGQNDWRLDPNTGTITFYTGVPSGMPPKVSFYKYVGTKGVGSGSGGGAGLNFIEGDSGNFEKGIGNWEVVDYRSVITGVSPGPGLEIINSNKDLPDGTRVRYSNDGGSTIGGLTSGSDYYVIRMDVGEFRLAATPGGSHIDLTSGGDGSLTPYEPITIPEVLTGSLDVEIALDDVSPLNGEQSAILGKAGSFNGFGHGFRLNVPIPLGYRGNQSLALSFVKNVAGSNNYVKGDFKLFLVDPTSQSLIELIDDTTIGADALPVSTRFIVNAVSVDVVVFITTNQLASRFIRVDDFVIKPLEVGTASDEGEKNYILKQNRNFEAGSIGEWKVSSRQVSVTDVQIVTPIDIWPAHPIFASRDGIAFLYKTVGGTGVTGLVDGSVYYTVQSDGSTFKLSATKGGSPITMSATWGNSGQLYSLNFFPSVSETTNGLSIETANPIDGIASLKWSEQKNLIRTKFLSVPVTAVNKVDAGQVLEVSLDYDATDVDFIGPVEMWLCKADGTVLDPMNETMIVSGIGRIKRMFRADVNVSQTYKLVLFCNNHEGSTNVSDLILDNPVVRRANPVSVPITQEQVIDLTGSGDFTGGSIRVSKVGQSVTITQISTATFLSNDNPASAVGLIPEWARPSANVFITSTSTATTYMVAVRSNGTYDFVFRAAGTSNPSNRTSFDGSTISYTVPDTSGTLQGLAVNANPPVLHVEKIGGSTSGSSAIASWSAPTKNIGFAFNTTTGLVTIPEDGDYYLGINGDWSTSNSTAGFNPIKNGTPDYTKITSQSTSGSNYTTGYFLLTNLKKGDTIAIGTSTGAVVALNSMSFSLEYKPSSATMLMAVPEVKMRVDGYLGVGSTNLTTIRYDQVRVNNPGSFFTYNASAALGSSYTINVKGRYRITQGVGSSNASAALAGITVNSANPSGNINGITYANGFRAMAASSGVGLSNTASWSGVLNPGDIVRTQFDAGSSHLMNSAGVYFEIEFLGYVS